MPWIVREGTIVRQWKGWFITFEGTEGTGKTTQVALFCSYLQTHGIAHIRLREPGGTSIGDAIRAILLDRANSAMRPEAELFLYLASRAQLFHEKILPALEKGLIVVCDRFLDSTVAYQGYGRGIDLQWIQQLHHQILLGRKPDLTILVDCPVEDGLSRTHNRAASQKGSIREDRFERETIAFHQRVHAGYLNIVPDKSHGAWLWWTGAEARRSSIERFWM